MAAAGKNIFRRYSKTFIAFYSFAGVFTFCAMIASIQLGHYGFAVLEMLGLTCSVIMVAALLHKHSNG